MNARELVPLTDSEIQESYGQILSQLSAKDRKALPSPMEANSLRAIQTYTTALGVAFGLVFVAGMSRLFSYWGEAAWIGGVMSALSLAYRLSPDLRGARAFRADDPAVLLPVVEAKRIEIESQVSILREELERERKQLKERVHQMDTRRQTVSRSDAEWDETLAAHREGYSLEERRLRRLLEEVETDLSDLSEEATLVLRALDLARSLLKYPDAGMLLAEAALVDAEVEAELHSREAEVAEFQQRMEAVRSQMTSLTERLTVAMRR